MKYERDDVIATLKYLDENFPDEKVNNNKYIASNENEPITITREFKFESMKQSVFRNVHFRNCQFENAALTGSSLDFVNFTDTSLIGNSFANCDFYKVDIDGKNKIMEANNFSQSNFEKCTLNSVEMFKSGVINALFHNCQLNGAFFHGSTFEGTKFINCTLIDCDLGNVNLDYTLFSKNTYQNVIFPFYQIAYIIGSADFMNNGGNGIQVRVGERKIKIAEYKEQIDKLIIFYREKDEYFPVCNLSIAQENYDDARSYLMDGINKALTTRNFRMVSNFCQLAKYHGIVNDKIRYKINKTLDTFIQGDYIPETQLNYYLIYIGKIKTLLNEGTGETVTLNFSIKTNTCKKNEEGVNYVNGLLNDLNLNLSKLDNIEGFEVSVLNHSPFEIAVGVITVVESVVTIGKAVFDLISDIREKRRNKKSTLKKEENYGDPQTACLYIDERIERAKYQIMDLYARYKGKRLNKYIEQVTQSLKTDIEQLYTKEVMFFKLKKSEEK